jgi:hypothetical protein
VFLLASGHGRILGPHRAVVVGFVLAGVGWRSRRRVRVGLVNGSPQLREWSRWVEDTEVVVGTRNQTTSAIANMAAT